MSNSEFEILEIMSPNIVIKVREQIAKDIEKAATAGPAQNDLEDYWVAGMLYAAKLARGQ